MFASTGPWVIAPLPPSQHYGPRSVSEIRRRTHEVAFIDEARRRPPCDVAPPSDGAKSGPVSATYAITDAEKPVGHRARRSDRAGHRRANHAPRRSSPAATQATTQTPRRGAALSWAPSRRQTRRRPASRLGAAPRGLVPAPPRDAVALGRADHRGTRRGAPDCAGHLTHCTGAHRRHLEPLTVPRRRCLTRTAVHDVACQRVVDRVDADHGVEPTAEHQHSEDQCSNDRDRGEGSSRGHADVIGRSELPVESARGPTRTVGNVAREQHPMHDPAFVVVGDRVVLTGPVVPEGNRVHLPPEPALDLG